MSEVSRKPIDEEELDTVLAEDIDFEGEMSFEKPLLVKGRFRGSIHAQGDLFVSRSANIDAEVNGQLVSVKGRLAGKVRAAKRVELFAHALLEGDVETPDLIMQSGGRFNGTCRMSGEHPARPETGDADT